MTEKPQVSNRRLLFKILGQFLSFFSRKIFWFGPHHSDEPTLSPGKVLFINQFTGLGKTVIDELDHVKPVGNYFSIGEPSSSHFTIRGMHIHTNDFDFFTSL